MVTNGELDDRKSAILRAIVQQYIETAQPVGSTRLAEAAGVAVSSATIRNEMMVLERDGFLAQPHTSAGRVPTEKGYRYFVDAIDVGGSGGSFDRSVADFFRRAHTELEQMLADTSRLLGRLTSTTAVVVDDTRATAVVKSVQIVSLASRVALVVAVLSNGSVVKGSIDADADLDDADLDAVAVCLRSIVGSTLGDTLSVHPTGNVVVDRLAARAAATLGTLFDEEPSVFVDGASRIAHALDGTSHLEEVLALLEKQVVVVRLIRDVVDRGLNVAIGSETGVEPLAECSLVVAPFDAGADRAGTIAVLGPTRMNYPAALAAVTQVSRQLSRILTEG